MSVDGLDNGAAQLNTTNGNSTVIFADPAGAQLRIQNEMQELQSQRRSRPPAARAMRDVTDDFVAATEQLQPGDLIQDEYFTLFEAVGALEGMQDLIDKYRKFEEEWIDEAQITDPKMDSGYIPPGDSLEPDFDVCAPISPSQVLWIMDEILRLEMSFQDGFPLSQNLFTSLHIFDLIAPDNTDFPSFRNTNESTNRGVDPLHNVLSAYCVAVLKCTQSVLDIIQRQMYFEEEDFVTHLFGRELLPVVSHNDARKLLVAAMDWLDDSDIERELKHAIKYRLLCREYLLFSVDDSYQLWDKLRSKLDARRHDGTNILVSQRELATAIPEAFSTKVTRQLATSTPPRPMPALSWEDARVKWVQLCDDIVAAQRLTARPTRQSPHALQRATWAFGYRLPVPYTFARAKMQDILCMNDSIANDVTHWDLILADMRELFLAGDPATEYESFQVELTSDPRHKVARIVEEFMVKAFDEYLHLYRFACQNRCRLRRLLGQSVGVWWELELAAITVDQKVRKISVNVQFKHDRESEVKMNNPIWSWTANNRLQAEEWFIQLGFETDIYSPTEMALVLVALSQVLVERESIFERAQVFILERLREASKRGQEQSDQEARVASAWAKCLTRRNRFQAELLLALIDLYYLLERLGIIDMRPKPYENAQMWFEARMKPLLLGAGAKSSFLSLDQLQAIKIGHAGAVRHICSTRIPAHLKAAREHLTLLKKSDPVEGKFVGTEAEWMNEIKQLERTCISLGVEATKLQAICEKHGKDEATEGNLGHAIEMKIPLPSERYHIWWAVPQIKEKKIE